MKGAFFYNKQTVGDILVVQIDGEKVPTSWERHDDVTLIYSGKELIGINLFNISSIVKIKQEGRIMLPPDQLVDIVNNKISQYSNEKIDYVKESGFKVGKITECVEHPESDHLHLLKVDVGNEVLAIVCGALNVKVGLKVVVATIGTTLINGSVIKKGNLLGEESFGMCCSPKELGLKIDYPVHHLLELDDSAKLGEDFFSLKIE